MYYTKKVIYIKELKRSAKLYIGFPDSYLKTKKRYPVLYMHDGHNLFDPNDAFIGITWGVKEAYNNNPDLKEVIVVGLSCAEGLKRLQEYNIFSMDDQNIKGKNSLKGYGDKYLKYIVKVLKPKIDANYRTLTDANNTAMMGSSMGGVISNQAALLYPEVFGRIGCVSNAFYISFQKIVEFNQQGDFSKIKKFYMDVGTNEGNKKVSQEYLSTNRTIYKILKQKIKPENLKFKVIRGGIHSERAWAKRLPSILKFLFS